MIQVLVRLALVAALALAAACARTPAAINGPFQNEPVFSDLAARSPRATAPQTADGLVPIDGGVGVSQTFQETAGPARRTTDGATGVPDDGATDAASGAATYRLNFDEAPLSQVVRSILSDALGLNYSTGVDLSRTVTISSVRPVRRDELLAILENLLEGEGLALLPSGEGYTIAPAGTRVARVDGAGVRAGYGISVVPLRHVSVEAISPILEGFVVPSEDVRVNLAQDAVVVRGSAAARRAAVEAILSFDVDWMEDQTVSIFELRRSEPAQVVDELEEIFSAGGAEAQAAGAIEFKAIERLKAVMALSKNPTLVRRAAAWVRRLDVANSAVRDNVFVYRAKHRNAAELARIVASLFEADAVTSRSPEAGRPLAGGGDERDDVAGFAAPDSEDRFADAALLVAEANGDAEPGTIDLTTRGGDGAAVRVSADVANNAVVVYADGETFAQILATLKTLDATPVQVAINVTIAEVRLTEALEFGVQYFVKSGSIGLDADNGSVSLFTEVANTLQQQIPGFNFVVGSNSDPDVIISALDAITDVEILSSPSLVVVENETATLQVGDSVPVTVRQAQSVQDVDAPIVNQVEFRDTGIILEVTPRIGDNDAVTMRVAQEISAVTGDPNSLTPTFSRRRVTSAISVQSGQTVLLAGMISARRTLDDQGIPLLKDVPGVGKLFSETRRGSERTELVVLIRPVVIRSGQDAQSVAEELRMRMPIIGGRDAPIGVVKP
ncbi:type II secretion system secretin GspD [Acuticoccus sp.]|uniref:type II secretion system secretin GspD n=1 Tax=Acuticoccus sp. TaxID=1904378 RepID=UPI003B51DAE5